LSRPHNLFNGFFVEMSGREPGKNLFFLNQSRMQAVPAGTRKIIDYW
jgi:hypothetical protein